METLAVRRGRTGLILGKFMPPHAGHLHLVRRALDHLHDDADQLVVLVCALAREPIPGALRFAWMRELMTELSPKVRVVHVTDAHPSEPAEHPRFWEIWTETIRGALPEGADLLFTSEQYGHELARRIGAEHVMIDANRRHIPISATMVRANPAQWWDYLPDSVRAYYAKRVVLIGPESTGKTTLARRLAEHYGTAWVPEHAREYVDRVHAGRLAALIASDVEPIARGQIAAEDTGARMANRVLFLDTNLVSTSVYATHYYERCPEWIDAAASERPAHLYLLLDIDVPWVADSQRDRPHERAALHALFRESVARRGVPVVEISGSWDERFARAISAVDALLGAS